MKADERSKAINHEVGRRQLERQVQEALSRKEGWAAVLSATVLATSKSLDALGRPTHFTWTVDPSSGGAFPNATGQGTLDVRLDLGRKPRALDLGRRGLHGIAKLRLPPGRWHATVAFTNSAGRTSRVSLGFLPR